MSAAFRNGSFCLVSLALLAACQETSRPVPAQPVAQEQKAQRVRTLSEEVLQLEAQLARGQGQGPAVDAARLRRLAGERLAERATAFQALIEAAPREALAQALPDDVLARVRESLPESARFLERRGSWEGPVRYFIATPKAAGPVSHIVAMKRAAA